MSAASPSLRTSLFAVIGGLLCIAPSAWAETPATATTELQEPEITDADRDHWAFRPLVRPEPPQVQNADWPRTDIDRFILKELEVRGMTPLPPANRRTLLRRLSYDLTGLPPTPEEIATYLADESPDATERVIDRLLASPAFGEHWAVMWLDLARFAETDGFEHDLVRPNAWRYRDWVIDSLNADLPYDKFLQQQLAGDMLAPDQPSAAIPTGFLLCGPDMPDVNLQEERRHFFLNDMTSTVAAVCLGLQLGCAQCHDHKYDPLSQADFYRLRAYFDSTEMFPERPVPTTAQQVAFDLQGEPLPLGRVVREGTAQPSFLMIRGDFRRRGPELAAAVPRVLMPEAVLPEKRTESRADLARQLTQPDHPLVTRVIVNRLWQQMFGAGLVGTPNDFGRMGDEPSHPELLDWLATELPRRHWSLKSLIREMALSATYCQASRPDDIDATPQEMATVHEAFALSRTRDPRNEWLSRMPRRRLTGEQIRDSLLAASGRLNPERDGPGVRPPLPPELVGTLLRNQWDVTPDPNQHRRRSLYIFVRRNLRFPLLEAFDRPDPNISCARRNQSTIAPQALILLNSDDSLTAAQALAGQVWNAGTSEQQVAAAMERTLGRLPRQEEALLFTTFLADNAERLRAAARPAAELALPLDFPEAADPYAGAALTDACLALFNLNEFVFLD